MQSIADEEVMRAMTDEALCACAAQGDLRAEEELVKRYNRLVRACARPYFLLGGDGEDLIQEGMLGLLKAIREYQPDRQAAFSTFAELCIRSRLYTVLKTAACEKHSPLNRSIPLDDPFFDGNSLQVPAGDQLYANPEDIIIGRESVDDLLEKVRQQLSEFETKILTLYLDGLSYQEIAEITNRSTKSVDNAVQRVRRKIAPLFNLGVISEN